MGAVVTARLQQAGHSATVVDNLSTGHRAAVSGARLVEADLEDDAALEGIFSTESFAGVVHFASHCRVEESIVHPGKYFRDNVGGSLKLFDAMLRHGVKSLVFSSSCAVYGEPSHVPITEDQPLDPINPYGESKLFVERILKAYERAYGMRSVSLRYFNACGAAVDGRLGESHHPETHLIPLVLRAATDGDYALTLFGDDYQTPDGTCVRDYIHVEDLATAHLAALKRLLEGMGREAYNIGTGNGLSVRQIIESAQRVTGSRVRHTVGPRRDGDPPVLVADASRAKSALGWTPRYSDPETILSTAWNWFRNPRY